MKDDSKDKEMVRLKSQIAALEELLSVHELTVFEQSERLERATKAVAKHAAELETVAQVSTVISTILEVDKLLQEVTNLTKTSFDLYHVQIYLLNEAGDTLNLAAGAGGIGQQMVAQEWSIPLEQEQSLVARAARTRQGVIVNNAHELPDWAPNPLLPDTRSEMTVPMIVGDRVLGVLDVQQDKVSSLNESDANLMRSLANQVAVAMVNAQLFEQTQQRAAELVEARDAAEIAKTEAEIAKEEVEAARKAIESQMWHATGQAQLGHKMRGQQNIPSLANNVIQQLCQYLDAQVGTLYIMEDDTLKLAGGFAYTRSKNNHFKLGEGLVGQAALAKQAMTITDIPEDRFIVRSSLGHIIPKNITALPFVYEDRVIGVIEMGTLTRFASAQMEFLQKAMEIIAITFNTAQVRARIDELLTETQQQAEELQVQGEELRVANEELESQTESLRDSEAQLREKQVELEATNIELEEKAAALEESSAALREKQAAVDRQNQELKVAQAELERKAEELALASKYKSEFLANMSHELRTPLNSLLILAGMLVKNSQGNLTEDQVESLQVIHSGGQDLLELINEILDLSKVEAGRLTFNYETISLVNLVTTMQPQFTHVAEEKGLDFNTTLADGLPESIKTDRQRIRQIIKNLLSNAFKFTEAGSVSLNIYRPRRVSELLRSDLDPAQTVAISITDTGIGMTPEQQKVVFEAFQQADGGTSRKYGGTGLGLSISRELALKLGGQIEVESEPGRGSIFTLYLPVDGKEAGEQGSVTSFTGAGERHFVYGSRGDKEQGSRGAREQGSRGAGEQGSKRDTEQEGYGDKGHLEDEIQNPKSKIQNLIPEPLPDDRNNLEEDDKILLIIEDDSKFAKIVRDSSRQKGFKCLIAADGATGLELAQNYHPDAIILDLHLPNMSGWEVLGLLKRNPDTRHIPVDIMSVDDETLDAYKRGAIGYVTKPVSPEELEASFEKIEQFIDRTIKNLLVVEDDERSRLSIRKLLEGSDVKISETERGETALQLLRQEYFDCMILDLSLPDMSGFEVLNQMHQDETIPKCPVIVYTGRDLSQKENLELMKYADSVIVKGVKSPERLLDETALFLHRVVAELSEEKQQAIRQLHSKEALLEGKKVLIVDDDMRNSFALSKLLGDKGVKAKIAQDGQKALDLLAEDTEVDLVLMDIMMPVMDGYEAIKQIRAQRKFKTLPILALTAKAMKGDREKCIAAGANDYLPKPIDPDRLFSMLRVWLY